MKTRVYAYSHLAVDILPYLKLSYCRLVYPAVNAPAVAVEFGWWRWTVMIIAELTVTA